MGGLDPPTQGNETPVLPALDGRLKAGHGDERVIELEP